MSPHRCVFVTGSKVNLPMGHKRKRKTCKISNYSLTSETKKIIIICFNSKLVHDKPSIMSDYIIKKEYNHLAVDSSI